MIPSPVVRSLVVLILLVPLLAHAAVNWGEIQQIITSFNKGDNTRDEMMKFLDLYDKGSPDEGMKHLRGACGGGPGGNKCKGQLSAAYGENRRKLRDMANDELSRTTIANSGSEDTGAALDFLSSTQAHGSPETNWI